MITEFKNRLSLKDNFISLKGKVPGQAISFSRLLEEEEEGGGERRREEEEEGVEEEEEDAKPNTLPLKGDATLKLSEGERNAKPAGSPGQFCPPPHV